MPDKNTPDNPWSNNKKRDSENIKPKDIWSPPPEHQRGSTPPDLDELLSRFAKGLGGKHNGSGANNPFSPLVIILVLLIIWLASGIYRILPEEQGVILRFGAMNRPITTAGLGYHMPWPIETLERDNVTFERRLTIGFTRSGRGSTQDIPEESLMLTGDANIIDLDFVVQWKIGNLTDYLYKLRDPENSIKKVAESVMREVVGQNDLQRIITEKRADVSERVKALTQEILNEYGAGVIITQVLIEDATVPPPVMDAFEDIVRAAQDAETAVNKAQEYRNDIVPRARGEAIKIIQGAQGYKEKTINNAKGESGRFDQLFKSYSKSKDVTRDRLYLETMEEILQNGNLIIIDQDKNGVLPYLPLNELRGKKMPVKPDDTNNAYQ